MTHEDVINSEITRVINHLPDVNPWLSPELYDKLLGFARELVYFRSQLRFAENETIDPPTCEPKPEPSIEEFKPPVMNVVEEEDDAKVAYTAEEVRAAMAKARMGGTNVNAILSEFGVGHFNALPASKYPDVMARLGEL